MSLCTIELNDSEIRVAQDSNIVLRSPGYAIIHDDKIELGEAAVRQAHLHPRAANNRYWNNLNQDALQTPSNKVRHNADLAYAHLQAIYEQAGKPAEVVFAVPGSYSNEQLALLLGLVEASPFQAIGLVDIGVAALASSVNQGSYTHVDIHLHQTVLTSVEVTDDIARRSVQVVDGVGLATIHDTCAFMISDLFIKQSRFDPQHHAETEQALYSQIPQCLQTLTEHPEVLLEIQYQGTQHQAKLLRETLLSKLQDHYQKIVSAIPAGHACFVSDHLASLPGFTEQHTTVTTLDARSLFLTCQQQLEHIRSSGPALNFITRLPTSPNKSKTTQTQKPQQAKTGTTTAPVSITHVLSGHQAYPLNANCLYLSATGQSSTDKQQDAHARISLENGRAFVRKEGELTVFLNGQQIDQDTETRAGDIISFSGSKTEYMFIHVGQ